MIKSLAYGHLCPAVKGETQGRAGQLLFVQPGWVEGKRTLRDVDLVCSESPGFLFRCALMLL